MAAIAPEEIKVEVDWDSDNLTLKTDLEVLEDSQETEVSDVEDVESYPKYDKKLKRIYLGKKREFKAEPVGGVPEGCPCPVAMDVTNESKSAKKRARTENWLDEDKRLLTELVRERVHAIENKNTDTNTNKRKKEAWMNLQAIFNSQSRTHRNIAQLKNQWAGMKVAAKKEMRKQATRNGGGPELNDRQEDDITAWLPCECTVDSNDYISESIATAAVNEQEHEQRVDAPQVAQIEVSVDIKPTLETLQPPRAKSPPGGECLDDNTPTSSSSCKSIDKRIQKASKTKILKKKTKKIEKSAMSATAAAATMIVETENNCRLELHRVQMENERKRGRNLDLEYQILRAKLDRINRNHSD